MHPPEQAPSGIAAPRVPFRRRGTRVLGAVLAVAFGLEVAGASPPAGPSDRWETAAGLWAGRSPAGTSIRSTSFIALRHSGHLGEALAALGDADGDGLADFCMGGGRCGATLGTGAAFEVRGSHAPSLPRVEQVFEGSLERTGMGRILASGVGPGMHPALLVGRPDQFRSDILAQWWLFPGNGQAWERCPGPAGGSLRGLVGAVFPGDVDGNQRVDVVVATALNSDLSLQGFEGFGGGFSSRPSFGQTWPMRDFGPRITLHAAGDVDQDGRADLLVAFPGDSNQRTLAGCVGLWSMPAGGPSSGFVREWRGASPGDEFGASVLVTDLSGDSIPDLVIGAPGTADQTGEVLVFLGTRGSWETRPWAVFRGPRAGSRAGETVAAGRFRGPRQPPSLVIGAPGRVERDKPTGPGCVYILQVEAPGPRDLAKSDTLRLAGDRPYLELGRQLVVPGDMDGDACDELVVSMHRYGHRQNNAGRVDILHGAPDWPRRGTWHPVFPELSREGSPPAPQRTSVSNAPSLVPTPVPSPSPSSPANRASPLPPATWGLATLSALLLLAGLVRWRRRIESSARETERRRIARDLHDELGARLGQLAQASAHPATTVSEAAREVTTGIGRAIWSMHPDRRSLPDLAYGLMDLADGMFSDAPIRRRFDMPESLPDIALAAVTIDAVYRATQEALNNVIKHSHAREVLIRLEWITNRVAVSVEDDGRGLPTDGLPRPGLGMANMAGRLAEVGGQLHVEPRPGGGLRIRIEAPR